jgi:cell division protein FtsQ
MAASVLVAWGLRRYLHKSPRFAIAVIQIDGNQRLTVHQISKRGGIATGNNIFKLDEQRAEAAVKTDPWIESVKVTKELPDTVRIRVTEREAVVAASIDDKLYLVDSKGTLFKEVEAGDPSDLPVVTGVGAEAVRNDREGATLMLRRVIDLLGELERDKVGERFPIQELALDREGNVTVFAGVDGIALVFGQPPYRVKVEKAKRIFAELRARRVKPDVLFLDNRAHPERVVVRMRAEGGSKGPLAAKEVP